MSPYTRLFEYLAPQKKRSFEKTYQIIESTFGGPNVEDTNIFYDRDLIQSLFFSTKTHTGCKSSAIFFKRKACVLDFYVWLMDRDIVDRATVDYVRGISWGEALSDKDISNYFRDLPELIDYINAMARLSLMSHGLVVGDVEKMFMPLKSLCVLLWYGVQVEECCGIQISDLDYDARTVTVGDRKIPISYNAFRVLAIYAKAYEYTGASGRTFSLPPSEYLFRTKRTPRMESTGMWDLFRDFNVMTNSLSGNMSPPHKLDARLIIRNGLIEKTFSVAQAGGYQYKKSQVIALMCKYGNISVQEATRAYHLYQRWVEYFNN